MGVWGWVGVLKTNDLRPCVTPFFRSLGFPQKKTQKLLSAFFKVIYFPAMYLPIKKERNSRCTLVYYTYGGPISPLQDISS